MDYRQYKNCDEETALQILTEHAEGAFWYLSENKDVYEDFCQAQEQKDVSVAEFIRKAKWAEFLDFLTDFLAS